MSAYAGVKKSGYKDNVLPSEAERLFLLENNKKAIDAFKHEMTKYLQMLADDSEMANTELMYTFLTYTDKVKMREKLLWVKKQNNLKDLCSKMNRFNISQFDKPAAYTSLNHVDDVYVNYDIYFEHETPEELYLAPQDLYRARGLLDFEKQLSNFAEHLEMRCKLNVEVALVTDQFSHSLEKFRINSETPQLDKLFLLGGFIDHGDVEDIENIALSKTQINEMHVAERAGEPEQVRLERFKDNKKLTLKENSAIVSTLQK
jgi:hypothetical protein